MTIHKHDEHVLAQARSCLIGICSRMGVLQERRDSLYGLLRAIHQFEVIGPPLQFFQTLITAVLFLSVRIASGLNPSRKASDPFVLYTAIDCLWKESCALQIRPKASFQSPEKTMERVPSHDGAPLRRRPMHPPRQIPVFQSLRMKTFRSIPPIS